MCVFLFSFQSPYMIMCYVIAYDNNDFETVFLMFLCSQKFLSFCCCCSFFFYGLSFLLFSLHLHKFNFEKYMYFRLISFCTISAIIQLKFNSILIERKNRTKEINSDGNENEKKQQTKKKQINRF